MHLNNVNLSNRRKPLDGTGAVGAAKVQSEPLAAAQCDRLPAGLNVRVTSLDFPGLGFICCMAIATDGTRLYLCAPSALYTLSPSGLAVLAGHATERGFKDGRGGDARFDFPRGIALDAAGNVLVTDNFNHALRKVTCNGDVSTPVGNGEAGYVDAIGNAARFNRPYGIAVVGDGFIYVADSNNHCLRQVQQNNWAVSTLAGDGEVGAGFADRLGASARFSCPTGMAMGTDGHLIVADLSNNCIRRVTTTEGCVTTVAGSPEKDGKGFFADGEGTAARFNSPISIAVDGNNNILVADMGNHRIRMIAGASSQVTTVAGSATPGKIDGNFRGLGASARFHYPRAIALDERGRLLVAEHTDRGKDCGFRVVEASLAPWRQMANLLFQSSETLKAGHVAPMPKDQVKISHVLNELKTNKTQLVVDETQSFSVTSASLASLRPTHTLPAVAGSDDCGEVAPRHNSSGSSIALQRSPRSNDVFTSGTDGSYGAWLLSHKLPRLLGNPICKQFESGVFKGTLVNPSLFSAFGARWTAAKTPKSTEGLLNITSHALTAAFRNNQFNFNPMQLAELNLPTLCARSSIEFDGHFFVPAKQLTTYKSCPFCVLYEDGDVEWLTTSGARQGHRLFEQYALVAAVNANDSLHAMLQMPASSTSDAIKAAFTAAVRLIHPDHCEFPEANITFHALKKAFDTCKCAHDEAHSDVTASGSVAARLLSEKDLADGGLAPGRAVPQVTATNMMLPTGGGPHPPSALPQPPQPAPRSADAPASDPCAIGPAPPPAPASAYPSEDNIFGHCITTLSDEYRTWIQALKFLSDKELSGSLFELRDFPYTVPAALNDKTRTILKACLSKVLILAGRFEDSLRARDTLRQLARMLPILLLSRGHKQAMTQGNKFLRGKWDLLWCECIKLGQARRDKFNLRSALQISTGESRTDSQTDVLAQKLARAGNISKASYIVCSTSKHSRSPDTLEKLQAQAPQVSVHLDKRHWPTQDQLVHMRRQDDWLKIEAESFSIRKIRSYMRQCVALTAPDAEGWRAREHVGWMFSDQDTQFQQLIRTHLVLPYVTGDFFPGHMANVAGGRCLVFETPDEFLHPVFIGCMWRRCASTLATSHVRSNANTFFTSYYPNVIQFSAQKDGATSCAQVTQLLASDWPRHHAPQPLVVLDLCVVNSFCSVMRQPQFDVLAEKASKSYDNGRVSDGHDLPCPSSLRNFWGYFQSMYAQTSTWHFFDSSNQCHHLSCPTGGHPADPLEAMRFTATTLACVGRVFARHPSCNAIAMGDKVLIVAPLAQALAVAAELKHFLKGDLDIDLDVPKFNCFFPGGLFTDTEARALFHRALEANPQLSELAGMEAGVTTQGLKVAGVQIGNDEKSPMYSHIYSGKNPVYSKKRLAYPGEHVTHMYACDTYVCM